MKIPFQNTEIAFRSKTTFELTQAYFLFKLVGSPLMVRLGSGVLNTLLKTPVPFEPLLRGSLFRHFCGGENAKDCSDLVRRLALYNVGTILDYSIEGAQKESVFDATEKELLSTLTLAAQSPSIPFSVFKITGLARFELLEKLHAKFPLTASENQEWERAQKRVRRIIEKASQLKVRVLIDAEESWIQAPLDCLVESLMKEFNKNEVIVYHTLQMYRVDRLTYLERLLQDSQSNKFQLGIKLVRGAYMEKERKRAKENGYASPIQPDKSATDQAYDAALKLMVENIDRVAIFAGTHNEESTQLLVDLILKTGLSSTNPRIYFSQLLGMSDNLTFNLAEKGFNAAKYVPYGPVRELTPYLIRRAQENSAISGQTLRELDLITKELKRRRSLKSAEGHSPAQ
ncbi:MAG: proline dehydrogenase [Proteobacteria bacterium]|nr:proline dehydrogenase [Pseudomonadota bacterium]